MLLTICGGIFSIGGLYVSFDNVKNDVEQNKSTIQRLDHDISRLDISEIRNFEKRLTRVETVLESIDRQLDRIEKRVVDGP